MNSLDAIIGAGVGFEKTYARTRCVQQPGKRHPHNLVAVVASPLEDLNPMRVCLVFLLAAERAHHSQVGYQGRNVARTRDNLIEDKNTDVHAGLTNKAVFYRFHILDASHAYKFFFRPFTSQYELLRCCLSLQRHSTAR